jgi:hypothetical protein
MSGAIPLLPLHAFKTCIETSPLSFTSMNKIPTKYTSIYLQLVHLQVSALAGHLQGVTDGYFWYSVSVTP